MPHPTRAALPRPGSIANLGALALALGLGACANLPAPRVAAPSFPDPNERGNRSAQAFNDGFNQVVTRPIAGAYVVAVPAPARQAISNGVSNLGEPTVFINNLLQGRFDSARITFGRFLFNSTLGLFGIIDVAAAGGLPKQTGDFGQTLYVYGVAESPYFVLPVLGPGTPRDTVGRVVDSVGSPGLYAVGRLDTIAPYAIGGFRFIEGAAQLEEVEATSIDNYARVRSLYTQTRAAELLDGVGRRNEALGCVTAPTPGTQNTVGGPAAPARRAPPR